MRKIVLVFLFLAFVIDVLSQNVAITDDNVYSPHNSSVLDVKSTSKGMLIPRLSSIQRTGISTPALGLIVFDINDSCFYYYNGLAWINLSAGNANNIWGMSNSKVIVKDTTYNVGVGTKNPNYKFVVQADGKLSSSDTLFVVNNKQGKPVFLVMQNGVQVIVDETAKKNLGGFAVSGRTTGKGINDYFLINPDSARIYIQKNTSKKNLGGFAVSGRTTGKNGIDNYFNISGDSVAQILNPSKPRILWYPRKNAFLTGQVLVESPDSVGKNSMASGYESKAVGDYSQAFGFQSIARGDYSTAIGKNAIAYVDNSYAFGDSVSAKGKYSFALGKGSTTNGEGCFAMGYKSTAAGLYSFAAGYLCNATYSYGVSLGYNTRASSYSFAAGTLTKADGDYSIAIGAEAEATFMGCTSIGYRTQANYFNDIAMGNGTKADAGYSVAIGYESTTTGVNSIAMGLHDTATSQSAVAIGRECIASAEYALAMGYQAHSNGSNSISIGYQAKAYDMRAIAIGMDSKAYNTATSIGMDNTASGWGSTAMGISNKTYGMYSVALGKSNTAKEHNSFTMGEGNNAAGRWSVAFGYKTITKSAYTLAIGQFNDTTGEYYNQWYWNDPAFVIGNGTSNTARSNCFTIMKDGRVGIGSVMNPTYALELANNSYPSIGQARANSWLTYSDARIKTNLKSISYGLNELLQLKPMSYFHHNSTTNKTGIKIEDSGTNDIGLIAQEVYKIIPEAVVKPQDESKSLWSMSYEKLIPVLIKAIQEQQAQIKKLEEKNADLENKTNQINILKSEIEELKSSLKK